MSRESKVIVASLAIAASTFAQGGEVVWRADRSAQAEFTIAAAKFDEYCSRLSAGQKVEWKFDASATVDFNIHYHEGEQVAYPAQQKAIESQQGVLDVPKDQNYCWMWQNRTSSPVSVEVRLRR